MSRISRYGEIATKVVVTILATAFHVLLIVIALLAIAIKVGLESI